MSSQVRILLSPLRYVLEDDKSAGVAQLARASAFQAEGRGFESRFPLMFSHRKRIAFDDHCRCAQTLSVHWLKSRCSSGVERFLGKEEVRGSNPLIGSKVKRKVDPPCAAKLEKRSSIIGSKFKEGINFLSTPYIRVI